MKRLLPLLVTVPFLFCAATLFGQDTPEAQLQFVRGLRVKGYHDLTIEFIEKLKQGADPKLAQILTLEHGRTLVALARTKEPEQRAALFANARVLIEEFVAKNPAGPENALGRMEIARLASYQGEALLSKALREEEGKIQQDFAKKAEQQFMQANQELDAAIKIIPENERLPARFDRAVNFINLARTFIGQGNLEADRLRGEFVVEAKKMFESIANDDAGETGMLAQAWLVKCFQEIQAPGDAKKYYDRVMNLQGKSAQAAQRAVKVFFIQGVMDNPTLGGPPLKLDLKGKLKLIEDEGKKWLIAYPAFHKTSEGWTVRYEMALSQFKQGQLAMGKEDKTPPKAALLLFDQAQKQFAAIAESNSDYSEKANQKFLQISYSRMGEKTAVADLKDFEECYLKAQVEMVKVRDISAEIDKAPEKDREPLEKKRKIHHATSQQALARSLLLADAKTPAAKLDDARYFLAVGYMQSSDLYRAAVACEALGRTQPPSKRSPLAAGYAIQLYDDLLQRDQADEGARGRLKDLVEFVLSPETQKNWAGDPVTAVARYRLALLHNRDNDFKKAIEQLEKLPRDFAGYIYAQGELVAIAQKARQSAKDPAEKKVFQSAAQAALQRMNPLPADADPATTRMYFFAQLEQSSFLYADAAAELNGNNVAKATQHYGEMAKFLDDLKGRYDKVPKERLTKEVRDRFEFGWDGMKKYARLGLIEIEYRAGQYDKVLAGTADVEAEVKKQTGDGKAPIKLKDYKIASDMLVLTLRAKVQKGKIAEAKDLMHLIERLTGEDGSELERIDLSQILMADMRNQVEALKKAGEKEKLKSVVNNFSSFVDELAKKLDQKALKPADIIFLAQAYNSLEEFGKAAQLFAKIPPPAFLEKGKLDEAEDREVGMYWYLQLQYGKALRRSAKSKEEFGQAKKVLDRIGKHPNGHYKLEADMETLHILEDDQKFGTASAGWLGIMKSLSKQLATLPSNQEEAKRHKAAKDIYFDSYYQSTWCLYQYSQTKPVLAKPDLEKKYVTKAASDIFRLETSKNQEGWQIVGLKFRDLLQNEPKLRMAYEELKKGSK